VSSEPRRFIVRPAAEADIEEAALWYEVRWIGLGAEFLRAVDVSLEEIRRNPESYPQIYGGVRRTRIRRFPYALYFVLTSIAIQVVACMHSKRNPRAWQQRVE
jgi:plasmid stabilization system protein ParE